MTDLIYCRLQIFGSGFDAVGFSSSPDVPDGEITYARSNLPNLKSPIKAIQLGNVVTWQTEKRFYSKEFFETFHDFLHEEEFLINFVRESCNLLKILEPYRNDSTEIWLIAIYSAHLDDKPSGVYFSQKLIKALNDLGCSISTDIDFINKN